MIWILCFIYLFIDLYSRNLKKRLKLCCLKLVGCGSSETSKRREDYFLFLSNLSSLFVIIHKKKTKKTRKKTRKNKKLSYRMKSIHIFYFPSGIQVITLILWSSTRVSKIRQKIKVRVFIYDFLSTVVPVLDWLKKSFFTLFEFGQVTKYSM